MGKKTNLPQQNQKAKKDITCSSTKFFIFTQTFSGHQENPFEKKHPKICKKMPKSAQLLKQHIQN